MPWRNVLISCWVGLAWLASACEAEAPAAAADPGKAACAELATRLCANQQTCTPGTLPIQFGDVATCQARQAARCLQRLAAPDTSRTAAAVSACAAALTSVDCELQAFFDGAEACRPAPGPREDGSACADDGQCKSAYCQLKDANATCGTCALRAKAFEQCTQHADCDYGHLCIATKSVKRCTKAVGQGAACDADRVCATPFFCIGGTCQAAAKEGAACDTALKNCDAGLGHRCNPETAKCEAQTIADPFQKCGYFSGKYVLCGYGGRCALTGNGQGLCEVVPDDGEACSTGDQTPCRALATCSAGKCGIPDAKVCK